MLLKRGERELSDGKAPLPQVTFQRGRSGGKETLFVRVHDVSLSHGYRMSAKQQEINRQFNEYQKALFALLQDMIARMKTGGEQELKADLGKQGIQLLRIEFVPVVRSGVSQKNGQAKPQVVEVEIPATD